MLTSTAGDSATCPACHRAIENLLEPSPAAEGARFKAVLLEMADDEDRKAERCERKGDAMLKEADEPGIHPSVAADRQMRAESCYEERDIAQVHAKALRHAAGLIT